MTIFVDQAMWKKPKGRKTYAHMATDGSLEQLHQFALRIGVKRHFFHAGDKPHYDINEQQRITAIVCGAVEVTSKQLVRLFYKSQTTVVNAHDPLWWTILPA